MWNLQRSMWQAGCFRHARLLGVPQLRGTVVPPKEGPSMTKQETLAAYRLGRYRCPVPLVTTAGWDEGNWCLWINQQGEWTLSAWRITYDDGTVLDTNAAPYIDQAAAEAYWLTGQPVEVTETKHRTAVKVEQVR
jgi:hypothetical protein